MFTTFFFGFFHLPGCLLYIFILLLDVFLLYICKCYLNARDLRPLGKGFLDVRFPWDKSILKKNRF